MIAQDTQGFQMSDEQQHVPTHFKRSIEKFSYELAVESPQCDFELRLPSHVYRAILREANMEARAADAPAGDVLQLAMPSGICTIREAE